MEVKKEISIFWFRRDLRLEDNVGLYYALNSKYPVLPIFIFDTDILKKLDDKNDRRIDYIHQSLDAINLKLREFKTTLNTFIGSPLHLFKELNEKYSIKSVFINRDYEPLAIQRDVQVYLYFKAQNIEFTACKDQVIFDKKDILKSDQSPYTIYTPYSKKWKETLKSEHYRVYKPNYSNFLKLDNKAIPSLKEIGFTKTDIIFQKPYLDQKIIENYDKYRDFPYMQHTTQLGIALRFGTISIRECVGYALSHNHIWLNELIWREFFMMIIYHFPKVVKESFKHNYDYIQWRNNEEEFERWCMGETGYPIVDAGMKQLNATGYMHNRIRMITASFLCKHLLIDWRWGEAYFAKKLNDYDLSANNGNWQWVAGSGCDAAPYFRVFNPKLQMEKFDKNLQYVKQWVPKFGTYEYPKEIITHSEARERMLICYKRALELNFIK